MHVTALLLCALLARLLPDGLGLCIPSCAALLGARRSECLGLLLLAAAPCVGEYVAARAPSVGQAGAPSGAPSGAQANAQAGAQAGAQAVAQAASAPGSAVVAVSLRGRWRQPVAGVTGLDTAAGRVALRLASDLAPPDPGELLDVLARVESDGGAQAVAISPAGAAQGAWFERWREAARARIRRLVPARRGLVEALLLGRREDLSPAVVWACRATGTSHLLSLSGLHVALVAGALSALPGAGAARPLLPALLLGLFVTLAGAGTPLLRSALGWLLFLVGGRLGRQPSALHRLGSVALVLAVASPGLEYELSTQLSFLAMAGLLAVGRLPGGRLLAPLGAFLATAPLCAHTFGQLQPWGVLVTPLLVPPMAAVLALGLVAVLPLELFSALDPLTGPPLRAAADVLELGVEQLAYVCPAPLVPRPLPVGPLPATLLVLGALLALPAGRGAARVGA